jgi:MFS family permease
MVMWGVCSAGTAFVTDATTFVAIRFLLGIAEAGYFPGVAWFMTRWFPARHRGRAMGIFYACGAAAGVLGGPVSGNLLLLDGWHGLARWQWVFLIEGIPAVMLAIVCPFLLRDRVADAHFLTADERTWLEHRLEHENRQSATQTLTLMQALATPMILLLILGYLFIGFDDRQPVHAGSGTEHHGRTAYGGTGGGAAGGMKATYLPLSSRLHQTTNKLHAVVTGTARATIDGQTDQVLERGDVLAVPMRHGHALRGVEDATLLRVTDEPG